MLISEETGPNMPRKLAEMTVKKPPIRNLIYKGPPKNGYEKKIF